MGIAHLSADTTGHNLGQKPKPAVHPNLTLEPNWGATPSFAARFCISLQHCNCSSGSPRRTAAHGGGVVQLSSFSVTSWVPFRVFFETGGGGARPPTNPPPGGGGARQKPPTFPPLGSKAKKNPGGGNRNPDPLTKVPPHGILLQPNYNSGSS